jgi:hypothetical protein
LDKHHLGDVFHSLGNNLHFSRGLADPNYFGAGLCGCLVGVRKIEKVKGGWEDFFLVFSLNTPGHGMVEQK